MLDSKSIRVVLLASLVLVLSCQKKDENITTVTTPISAPVVIDPLATSENGVSLSYDDVVRRNFTQATGTTTSFQTEEYRYYDNGCDTYKRIFGSKAELCINLQLAHSNNSCAYRYLKNHFSFSCPGQIWDENLSDDYFQSTGSTVNCFYSEGNPTTWELMSGRKYISKQMTPKPVMLMQHESSKAIIFHSFKKGKFDIKIAIYDLNGKLLGEKSSSVQDQEPESLQLEISTALNTPRVTCWPAIRKIK